MAGGREADTALAATTTQAVVGDADLWCHLDRFHRSILGCIVVNAAAAEHAERGRLRRRVEFERRLFQDTLSRLAGAVAPPEEGEDDLETAEGGAAVVEDDPLLAACRLVGARSGIVLRAPVVAGERKKARRPDPRHCPCFAGARPAGATDSPTGSGRTTARCWASRAQDERPAALLPRGPSHYDLVDPATGTRKPVTAAVAASLAPFGYCFYRPFPPGPLTPWGLFRFALRGTRRRDWLSVFLLGLGGSLLGMFTPVATGWVFGTDHPRERSGASCCWWSWRCWCAPCRSPCFSSRAASPSSAWKGAWTPPSRRPCGTGLLNLPAPFFRRYAAGDLAFRALGVGEIRQVLTDVALTVLLTFLFSLAYFGLLFYYDVRLAGLACGVFVVALLAVGMSAWVQLRYQRGVYQVRGRVGGLVLQLITGVSRLRLAGAEDRALAVWARDFSVQKKLDFPARSSANVLAAFNAALPALATAALFGLVASLLNGRLGEPSSLGAFLAFYVAFVQVLASADPDGVGRRLRRAGRAAVRARPADPGSAAGGGPGQGGARRPERRGGAEPRLVPLPAGRAADPGRRVAARPARRVRRLRRTFRGGQIHDHPAPSGVRVAGVRFDLLRPRGSVRAGPAGGAAPDRRRACRTAS